MAPSTDSTNMGVSAPFKCAAVPVPQIAPEGCHDGLDGSVIPKHTPGQWRLIVDTSLPERSSVNDGIPEPLCSLIYVTSHAKGPVDIRSGYRPVPVLSDDWQLVGMLWEQALFVDTALPFKLRSAPNILTANADAAKWIVKQAGVEFLIHYLDDFFMIEAPGSTSALHTLTSTFNRLGISITEEKIEGPSTCLTFLGFEIDPVHRDQATSTQVI